LLGADLHAGECQFCRSLPQSAEFLVFWRLVREQVGAELFVQRYLDIGHLVHSTWSRAGDALDARRRVFAVPNSSRLPPHP
jgi:hypothetical protein